MTKYSHKEIRFNALSQAYKEACTLLNSNQVLNSVQKNSSNQNYRILDHKNLDRLAKKLIEEFKKQTDEKFWQVYWSLLEKAKQEHQDFDFNPVFEKEHINFAIRNAFFGYFGLISLIPRLYKQQFDKEIDMPNYKKACYGIRPLIYQLSKFHFDVFRAFIYATANIKDGVNTNLHVFYKEFFEFNNELELQLNKKAREAIKKETEILAAKNKLRVQEPAIGCPALFVKTNDQEDLIDLCLTWSLRSLDLQNV